VKLFNDVLVMPKRPATEIIEHRIAFAGSADKVIENVNSIAKTANQVKTGAVVVGAVGVAGVGYLAYNVAKWFGGHNPLRDAKDSLFDTLDSWFMPPTGAVNDIFDNRQLKLDQQKDKMVAYYQSIISNPNATDAQKAVAQQQLELIEAKYQEKTNYNNEARQRLSNKVSNLPVGGNVGNWYRGFKYLFD